MSKIYKLLLFSIIKYFYIYYILNLKINKQKNYNNKKNNIKV